MEETRRGRPLKFKSVKELETKIEEYFDECDREQDTRKWMHGEHAKLKGVEYCVECGEKVLNRFGRNTKGCIWYEGELKVRERYSITGLALALDTSRETLMDYQERDDFSDTIKKAKLRVENQYEQALQRRGQSGDIFALKNFNWRDKSETDVTSGGEKITGFVVELVPNAQKDPGSK